MKLILGEEIVSDDRFETESVLVDRYIEREAHEGRLVPAYELTALLAAIGVFLAKYLGTKALDYVGARLAARRERSQPQPDLEAEVARLRAGDPGLAEVLPLLDRLDAQVVVRLETPTEASLLPELRRRLPGVEIVAIVEG